jgi:hypothetical protein
VRLLPGSCRSNRPAAGSWPVPGRFLAGSWPVSGRFLAGSCPAAGSCPVPGRFLAGSCGRFLAGSWPVSGRFLAGSCPAAGSCPVPARFLVPSGRLLPGRFLAGSWPVPARQPGSIRLGRAVAAQEPGTGLGSTTLNRLHRWHSIAIGSRVLHHACGVVRGCFLCTALFGDIGKFQDKAR